MFGLGMSYRDIASHVEELYGINVSTATISAVTDKIIDEVKQWQQRPLESHYPLVWLDAIHYRVKEDGRYKQKAMRYVASKNHKAFMADLKPVYRAATLGEAEDTLDILEEK